MRWRLVLPVVATSALVAAVPMAKAQSPIVSAQAWAHTGVATTFVPESNRIYVAMTAGGEEARAFVRMDTSGVLLETLREAVLILVPADDGLLEERATLRACLLSTSFDGEGQLDTPPEEDCETSSEVIRSDDGTWQVPLEPFASIWADIDNHGLALLPFVEGATPFIENPLNTFRISFDTTETRVAPLPGEDLTASPGTRSEAVTPAQDDDPPSAPPIGPAASPSVQPPLSLPALPPVPEPEPGTDGAGDPDVSATPPGSATSPPAAGPDPGARPFAPSGALAVATFMLAGGLTLLLRTSGLRLGRIAIPIPIPPYLLRRIQARRTAAPLSEVFGGKFLRIAAGLALALIALLPIVSSELTAFRATLIPVFIVAAFGLHILVNWAGELSLAHASMVAVPGFSVLSLSANHGISPIYLLPLAIVVGMALGLAVSLPAVRVRGIQVAIVTLAAGIAVNQFLLTKAWFVGPLGGFQASEPTIGPLRIESNRVIYLVVLLSAVGALLLGWALLHSRIARAMFWVRTDPTAASAFGISTVRYRMLGFSLAGGFGGLAGGLLVVALGRITPASFPLTLSFEYLLPVVLAGPGYVGGLVVAAIFLQGGPIFMDGVDRLAMYAGPIALILIITRYRAGLNGAGRAIMRRLEGTGSTPPRERSSIRVEGLVAFAVACVAAGAVAIAVAWYRSGNTAELWIQSQELLSGGIGGLSLIIIGTGALVADRVTRGHREVVEALNKLRQDELTGPLTAAAAAATQDVQGAGSRPRRPHRPLTTTSTTGP